MIAPLRSKTLLEVRDALLVGLVRFLPTAGDGPERLRVRVASEELARSYIAQLRADGFVEQLKAALVHPVLLADQKARVEIGAEVEDDQVYIVLKITLGD